MNKFLIKLFSGRKPASFSPEGYKQLTVDDILEKHPLMKN